MVQIIVQYTAVYQKLSEEKETKQIIMFGIKGSTYSEKRDGLLSGLDGNDPLKLLYVKSRTSSSFSCDISWGISPERELLRKMLPNINKVTRETYLNTFIIKQ